jgi:hypothetical protein
MRRGILLIILGALIIVSLFVVDTVASKQTFGPPYTYEQGDEGAIEKYSTFYPERATGWVREYYNIDKILWGAGLPLSVILIGIGCWQVGKAKSEIA